MDMVPLKIKFNVSRFESALNWNRFLAVQRRGLNSLNSALELQAASSMLLDHKFIITYLIENEVDNIYLRKDTTCSLCTSFSSNAYTKQ